MLRTLPIILAMLSRTPILRPSLCLVFGILLGASSAFTTSGPLPTIPEHIMCDEMPPECESSYQRVARHHYIFTTPTHGYVDSVAHVFTVNTNRSVCSLDPMKFVTDITNRSTPIGFHFSVNCHPEKKTRVVLRPSLDLTSPLIFAYLDITFCTVYWKDLSTFGRHVDIRVMNLFAWTDEFGDEQPDYFRQCVVLDDLQGKIEGIEPSIGGLVNVGSLGVSSSPCICVHDTSVFTSMSSSPVFNRHLWPLMAEVTFRG